MHMKTRNSIVAASLCICFANSASMAGGNGGTVCPQPGGPNLIIGDIPSVTNYVAQNFAGDMYDAFHYAIRDCNVGDANSAHQAFPSNMHPAYAPAMYKLKDGRLEQIGIGWLYHGFTALTANECGCGCNGAGGSVLGPGCSNAYTGSSQGGRGPRWQINAFTGFFPTDGFASPPINSAIARLVRVRTADLEPSSASVKYFAEHIIVAQQDSSLGNGYDNASYKALTITGGPDNFAATPSAALVVREQPAIRAWKASDPDVVESDIQISDEGLFILAAKATHISGNVWNYEYALMNYNSDLSGRAFRIPLPAGAVVTNIGFHDVDYHSGDSMNNFSDPNANFSGQDWNVTITNDSIEWATETYAQNINANALRWGTMYNFRFNLNRAPQTGDVTLTTYKVEGEVQAPTVIPAPAPCPADVAPFDQPDGTVNVTDLLGVLAAWGPCVPGNYGSDITGDGVVNVADLLGVVESWGICR